MLKAVKKFIPLYLKYPFWYVLKAPQRQFGMGSIYRDFKGMFIYLLASILPIKLKPISICIGIQNRTLELENYVLKSLEKVLHPTLLEISLFDCGSENAEMLPNIISNKYAGDFQFQTENIPFERAYALNKAAENAKHELLFFCDIDFEIPKNIVSLVNRYTLFNCMWFPIVFYLYKNKPAFAKTANGEWMLWGGKGIFACQKKQFFQLGKLNEQFKTWGGEDEEFWLRCHAKQQVIIRNKATYLLHQWHPSKNEKYRKLAQQH